MFRTGSLLPVAALAGVAAAGLYPGLTTDNHTCILGMCYWLLRFALY